MMLQLRWYTCLWWIIICEYFKSKLNLCEKIENSAMLTIHSSSDAHWSSPPSELTSLEPTQQSQEAPSVRVSQTPAYEAPVSDSARLFRSSPATRQVQKDPSVRVSQPTAPETPSPPSEPARPNQPPRNSKSAIWDRWSSNELVSAILIRKTIRWLIDHDDSCHVYAPQAKILESKPRFLIENINVSCAKQFKKL